MDKWCGSWAFLSMMKRMGIAMLVVCAFLTVGRKGVAGAADGQLVVSICTKGQFRGPTDLAGMKALAELTHKYGFPVTWIIKPFTARDAARELEQWHREFGDEVAWFSEGTSLGGAEKELRELREVVTWQKVVSTGNTKYGLAWVELYQRLGIESVWGRCYEQTDADHICDRGSPHGFYYLRPDIYKAPNPATGGLISVPWLSNDPNLIFWSGFQSSFTFDPDDPMSMGFVGLGRCEYWFALVDQFQKQTRYNKFVPLIIQQEYDSGGSHPKWLEPMDELLAYVKRKGIPVVGQAESVRRYKAAYPERTPPTYAVFDSLGKLEIVRHPLPIRRTFEVTTNLLSTAFMGAPFNGYYTTDWNRTTDKRLYFHPTGKPFYDHGRMFIYYDVNGLLLFDENQTSPLRITNYLEIPPGKHGYDALPEMSHFYDTDRFIPVAVVKQTPQGRDLLVTVAVPACQSNIVARAQLPYGVMLWGDYQKYRLPADVPPGARIVGDTGLFLPVVLTVGQPARLTVTLRGKTP